MINKVDSIQLRGVAIILVLFGHLISANVVTLPGELRYFATFGVSVFLMLSGYGLVKSYIKSGLDQFFTKRFSSVILPFIIVTVILYICSYRNLHTFYTLIRTITFTEFDLKMDGTMWYVYYIVLMYFLFYFVFLLRINDRLKVVVVFVLSGYMFLFFIETGLSRLSFQIPLHAFSFPIGCLLGMLDMSRNLRSLLLLSSSLLFCCCYFILVEQYSLYIYMISSILFGISLLMLFSLSLFNISALTFFGSLAYEIYLLEGFFLWRLPNSSMIYKLIYFACIVILSALLLNKFNIFMQKKLTDAVKRSSC